MNYDTVASGNIPFSGTGTKTRHVSLRKSPLCEVITTRKLPPPPTRPLWMLGTGH